jgi:hypothetical protein
MFRKKIKFNALKAISVIFFLLAMISLLVCFLGDDIQNGVWITNNPHEAGNVPLRNDVETSFYFINLSVKPVDFKITPTCRCILLNENQGNILPFRYHHITMRISTKDMPQNSYSKMLFLTFHANAQHWLHVVRVNFKIV